MLDCYFFSTEEENEEDRTMAACCMECQAKSRRAGGWLWQGSVKGYGPWDVKCYLCEKYIHRVKNHDQDATANERVTTENSEATI